MSSTDTDLSTDGPVPNPFPNGVLEAVTGGKRPILSALMGRSSSVSEEVIASRLAAADTGRDPDAVGDGTEEAFRTTLRHVHLPALDEAGLVKWDESAGTVATTDHPAFESSWFRRLVEADGDLDDAAVCLTDRRRRYTLAVLGSHDGPVRREELAREVASRESDETASEDPDEVALSLHHVHLPKLDSAGVVEYDSDAGTVTCQSHPTTNEEWLGFLVEDGSAQ